MAGNRTIQILINALTNTKGFDDAQKGLVAIAEQAKAAGVGMDTAGKSARHMGEEMGGKRGQVADLTRVILMQIGATEGAGEAAKLAGIGLNFMEGAASGLNIAMATATAGVAFLVPLFMELTGASEKQGKANDQVKDSFAGMLEKIDEVISKGGALSKVEDDLRQALEAQRYGDQVAELKSYGDKLATVRQELENSLKLEASYQDMAARHAGPLAPAFVKQVQDLKDKISGLQTQEAELASKGKALEQSMLDGTSVAADMDAKLSGLKKSEEDAKDAADKLKHAQDALNQAFQEGSAGLVTARLKEIAPLLDKDSKALAEMEQQRGLGQLSEDLIHLLTTAPGPADEMGVALRNLGMDFAALRGHLEDIDAAFYEAQDLFAQGVISPKTLEKTNQAILKSIDELRLMGVAVESPFSQVQEMVLGIQENLEQGLFQAGDRFAETFAGAITGAKTSWSAFAVQVIRDLVAMIVKAIAFRAIMSFLSFVGGGAGAAAGAGAGAGISIGGGVVAMADGGLVAGGIPGLDSVLAFLRPGEMVLPPQVAQAFQETQAQAQDSRDTRAGRAASIGPSMAMAVQILPQRDREREAVDLLDEINRLVERRGYRLVASTVKS